MSSYEEAVEINADAWRGTISKRPVDLKNSPLRAYMVEVKCKDRNDAMSDMVGIKVHFKDMFKEVLGAICVYSNLPSYTVPTYDVENDAITIYSSNSNPYPSMHYVFHNGKMRWMVFGL